MSLLLLLLSLAVALAGERRYAVIIGNNLGDASDVRLQYAERDAQRLADVLQSLGGVQPADMVLLRNPDAEQVRGVLDQVSQRIAREASADRSVLFVYYSGHADAAELHLSGTRLSLVSLKQAVTDSPANVRVLVVDACRAGELTLLKGATPTTPFEITVNESVARDGMAIITSAAAGEDAQESQRLQGGVFSHHLIAGLQGAADTSGDHRVTLTEAYHYTYARTLMTTSKAPQLQHPSYSFDLRGQDDLVLTELEGARRVGYLELTDAGVYVVFDPKGSAVIAEIEVPEGGRVALVEGSYLLRRRTPAEVFQTTVTIAEGQTASIATSQMKVLPYGQTARRGALETHAYALGVHVGASMTAPLRQGMTPAPGGAVGLRLDLPPVTLDVRLRYAESSGSNDYLTIDQRAMAADVAAYKLFDVRRLSLGAGVRTGVERIVQDFTTTGLATDSTTYAGHLSPLLRAEVAIIPRLSVGLEGGVSSYFMPSSDGAPPLTTVPHVSLDVSVFVR